jgi:hypothetical protein
MKMRISLSAAVGCSALLLLTIGAAAQTTGSTSVAATPAVQPVVQERLPYGVDDVLKLSRAQVNEDIILNYVQNSGTIYNLGPNDIVYLRNAGVSDRVVNAMLDQRKRVPYEQAAQAAAQPAVPSVAGTYDAGQSYSTAGSATGTSAYAQVYAQSQVQAQPAPSTLYVIPYPPVRNAYYGYYSYQNHYGAPYYSGYYGPVVSFGFRFGGSHFVGGYHR